MPGLNRFCVNASCVGLLTAMLTLALAPAETLATRVTYDLSTRLGGFGTPVTVDGWQGDDTGDWIVATFSGAEYLRNSDDGDDTILRTSDGGFAIDIPAAARKVILEGPARINDNFWEWACRRATPRSAIR